MQRRLMELDALRGLAALTVLINHYLNLYPVIASDTFGVPTGEFIRLIKYSPFHFFWGGYQAVVFFFVLSGFVLSLPFLDGKRVEYLGFVVKRFCRIYLPYWLAVGLAIGLSFWLAQKQVSGLSHWFDGIWESPPTKSQILSHIALIWQGYDPGKIIPVIGTLVIEMRISLFFPLIVYVVGKYDWRWTLPTSFIVGAIAYHYSRYPGLGILNTVLYLPMFVTGIVLAKHRETLVKYVSGLKSSTKAWLLTLALLAYTSQFWSFNNYFLTGDLNVVDIFIALGASLAIVLSLSTRLSPLLRTGPLNYLGKISYSLYLYHAVFLIMNVHLFYPRFSVPLIWLLSLVMTFIASTLSYYYVENPSIKLGHILAKRLAHR